MERDEHPSAEAQTAAAASVAAVQLGESSALLRNVVTELEGALKRLLRTPIGFQEALLEGAQILHPKFGLAGGDPAGPDYLGDAAAGRLTFRSQVASMGDLPLPTRLLRVS